MEKYFNKQLPKVFKFSNISSILSYYGFLDEWKKLMERLNSQTKVIWENNREAFIYFGEKFKRDVIVNDSIRDNFKQFLLNHILFRSINIGKENSIDYLTNIWCQIQDNLKIIFYQSQDPKYIHFLIHKIDEDFSFDEFFTWKMHWPEFEHFIVFKKRKYLSEYLKEKLECSIIAVQNKDIWIEVKSSVSPILNLTTSISLSLKMLKHNKPQSEEWSWRPHTLVVNQYWCKRLIHNSSNPTPFKESIKNIVFEQGDYDWVDFHLFKLLKDYNISSFEIQELRDLKIFRFYQVLISCKPNNFRIIVGQNTYSIESQLNEHSFSGTIVDHLLSETGEWLILKLNSSKSWKYSIIKENEITKYSRETNELINAWRQWNQVYWIMGKEDINYIKVYDINQLKYLNAFVNLSKFEVDFLSLSNINEIGLVQKNVKLILGLYKYNELMLHSKDFWKCVLSFDSLQFNIKNSKTITIFCKESIIDQEDVFQSILKATKDNVTSNISVYSIISYALS